MYILYGNIASWTKLDYGSYEFQMLETMEKFLRKNENMVFKLVHYDEITTDPNSITIHGREEYIEFMKDYYTRELKNKTCMELKKEMFELIDEPKVNRKH